MIPGHHIENIGGDYKFGNVSSSSTHEKQLMRMWEMLLGFSEIILLLLISLCPGWTLLRIKLSYLCMLKFFLQCKTGE